MRLKIATLIFTLALTACAGIPFYTFEGQRYSNRADFLRAVEVAFAANLRQIEPLPAPITKKRLVFGMPSQKTMYDTTLLYRSKSGLGPLSPVGLELTETLSMSNFLAVKMFFDGAQKRNIYSSVRLAVLDTMTPELLPAPDEDIVYWYEPAASSGVYYFASAKSGKQVFSYDRAVVGSLAKMKSFNEAIQLQAIKE